MLRRNLLGGLLASFASVSSPTAWAQVDRNTVNIAALVQQVFKKYEKQYEQENLTVALAVRWAEVNPKLPTNLLELFAQYLRFLKDINDLNSSPISNEDFEWYLDDFFGDGVRTSLWNPLRPIAMLPGVPDDLRSMSLLMQVIFMPQSSLHNLSVDSLLSPAEKEALHDRDVYKLEKLIKQLDLPTHLSSINEWKLIGSTKQATTWDNILNSKKGKVPTKQSFYNYFDTLGQIFTILESERTNNYPQYKRKAEMNGEAVLGFHQYLSQRLRKFNRVPILSKQLREQIGDAVLEQTKKAIYQYVVSKDTDLKLPQEMLAHLNS